jgi:hypothetical protein
MEVRTTQLFSGTREKIQFPLRSLFWFSVEFLILLIGNELMIVVPLPFPSSGYMWKQGRNTKVRLTVCWNSIVF